MEDVFEALQKYLEKHPEFVDATKKVGEAERVVRQTELIIAASQPQPRIYHSNNTLPLDEQKALKRLEDFEEKYPGIVRLCQRMDEYQHLKAELAMAKLKIGSNHVNTIESEVE